MRCAHEVLTWLTPFLIRGAGRPLDHVPVHGMQARGATYRADVAAVCFCIDVFPQPPCECLCRRHDAGSRNEPALGPRSVAMRATFEYGEQEIPFKGSEDVPVYLWTYDFGPNKLGRRIRLIAGKADSIETREHGKNR